MGTTDSTTSTTDPLAEDERVYEKGTWQEALQRSSTLLDRSSKARKQASILLWTGAQTAIEEWLPGSADDVAGENLYNEVRDILGVHRKGDASKIKSVAVAVKDHGLVLTMYPNLFKAYAEAVRLTKTSQAQAIEDDAAEKAIENIDVPKSTTTVEGAAAILLGKGIDGAVVAILDALGANNFEAHRALIRAFSTEVAARVQAAKPKPVAKKAAGPKGTAQQATGGSGSSPKAAVKTAGTKAKPAKATAGTKAKPVAVSKSKGDPNAKPLPPKAKQAVEPSKGEPVAEPVEAGAEHVDTPPVATKKVGKARPVVIKR